MSLEAALDEERREVMDILEGRTTSNRNGQISSSGQTGGLRSPAPPVKSMLDIGDSSTPKVAPSTAPAPRVAPQSVRSMLDIGAPEPLRGASKTPSSPETSHTQGSGLHRARSDASEFRPRALTDRETVDPRTDYRFSMLPSIQNQALPKRVTQGGKKSIAPIMQGHELGFSHRGRDGGRHNSTAGIGAGSKSPSSRAFNRSQSPGTGLLPGHGKYVTESGKVIDMSTAYRKLNDAALLNSGGGLSNLPSNAAAARAGGETGEIVSPNGDVRLQKDYDPTEGEEDEGDSSEEDQQTGSSGDEQWGQPGIRGRQRKGTEGSDGGTGGQDAGVHNTAGMLGMGKTPGPRKAKSLLAVAEEEREPLFPHHLANLLGY